MICTCPAYVRLYINKMISSSVTDISVSQTLTCTSRTEKEEEEGRGFMAFRAVFCCDCSDIVG